MLPSLFLFFYNVEYHTFWLSIYAFIDSYNWPINSRGFRPSARYWELRNEPAEVPDLKLLKDKKTSKRQTMKSEWETPWQGKAQAARAEPLCVNGRAGVWSWSTEHQRDRSPSRGICNCVRISVNEVSPQSRQAPLSHVQVHSSTVMHMLCLWWAGLVSWILHPSHPKEEWSPHPQYLWMWCYLEIGCLQM